MNTLFRLCLSGALILGAVDATLPKEVDFPVTKAPMPLHARQAGAQTCGFKSGDPKSPRLANPGWYCATDTVLNYWGVRSTPS